MHTLGCLSSPSVELAFDGIDLYSFCRIILTVAYSQTLDGTIHPHESRHFVVADGGVTSGCLPDADLLRYYCRLVDDIAASNGLHIGTRHLNRCQLPPRNSLGGVGRRHSPRLFVSRQQQVWHFSRITRTCHRQLVRTGVAPPKGQQQRNPIFRRQRRLFCGGVHLRLRQLLLNCVSFSPPVFRILLRRLYVFRLAVRLLARRASKTPANLSVFQLHFTEGT